MKGWLTFQAFMAGWLLVLGCGRSTSGTASQDNNAFDSAAPEIKQTWQAALEASRTNDFEGSKKLFYSLITPDCTPAQQEAVKHAMTALDQKFSEALSKGDPAAQEALDALRKNPPNRGR